jgi:hypothetical protein
MRRAISRRRDRALNFSALWIGGHEAESAPYGINHEHSAAVVSLPVAKEVVTRNSGAGAYSIVTMPPDRPRCRAISDNNSAVLIHDEKQGQPM